MLQVYVNNNFIIKLNLNEFVSKENLNIICKMQIEKIHDYPDSNMKIIKE